MIRKSLARTPYATIIALVIVTIYYLTNGDTRPAPNTANPPAPSSTAVHLVDGAMMESSGIVDKILSDDNTGSRHQRFILRLADGRTLLVAHNIDLAPRIDTLQRGDTVNFRGQFETNARGGVVHWTHHDPRGEHSEGWLEHRGRRYE